MTSEATSTSPAAVVGIDLGGTKVLAVALAADGSTDVLRSVVVPTPDDPGAVVAVLAAAARSVAQGTPVAVGVGLAGFVGSDGVVRASPNAPAVVGLDASRQLGAELGVPAVVDNDANCAAWGARSMLDRSNGAPAPGDGLPDDLVMVTLGTGIGGGLVAGGRLQRGRHGFAGEVGHMVVDPNGPLCPCGRHGCWERYASGSGLELLARRAIEAGRAPSVLEAAGGALQQVTGELITGLARRGDAAAEAVLDEFVGWLVLGLANLLSVLDPSLIVIGGGLAAEEELLGPRVRERLAAAPVPAVREPGGARIVFAPTGPEVGAIGAALLALDHIGGPARHG